jgi:uncharacterized membrane protein
MRNTKMTERAREQVERWMLRGAQGGARVRTPEAARLLTGLAGVALLLATKESAWRVPAALVAGAVIARAASGTPPFWSGADRMSTQDELSGGRGEDVQEYITIARPVDAVYGFWRTLSSLGAATRNRISVTTVGPERSEWQLRAGDGEGPPLVEWTAEIVNDVPGKLLGWRTTGDADVASAGSVHFEPAPGDRGTEVQVHLRVAVPFGWLGAKAAAVGRHSPSILVREALRDIKRYLEIGRPVALTDA